MLHGNLNTLKTNQIYHNATNHYSHFTWASWRLKSTATRLVFFFEILFPLASKKQSPRQPALWEGNLPVADGFPSQMGSNTEGVSVSWRRHVSKRWESARSSFVWRFLIRRKPFGSNYMRYQMALRYLFCMCLIDSIKCSNRSENI